MVVANFSRRICLLHLTLICIRKVHCKSLGSLGQKNEYGNIENMKVFPILSHHVVSARYLEEVQAQIIKPGSIIENEIKDQRNLRHSGTFESVTEVYQGYGAHYIDLWVGTPPQRQTVLVDTGSSSTAFPCNDCEDCGQGHHMDPNFNWTNSKSFRNLECSECLKGSCSTDDDQCKIFLSYAEGSSWNAVEVSDIVHLGGFHNVSKENDHSDISVSHGIKSNYGMYDYKNANENNFRMKFGCQTNIVGLFKQQMADGIMGLSNTKESMWNQMYLQNVISSKKFSLCYVKHPVAHFDGSFAGSLIFGGTDKRLHAAPMVHTDFYSDRKYFDIKIQKIHLHPGGGEYLTGPNANIHLSRITTKEVMTNEHDLNRGGPIVDSGTTCVYLNEEVKKPFNDAFKQMMGFDFPTAQIHIDGEQLKRWPSIIIQLKGSRTNTTSSRRKLTGDEEEGEEELILNKAGRIDPDHPDDILIAFPPSHYMEYNVKNLTYFSRLEFISEGGAAIGPVLGAAILQGHDVLFDIENKQIGIAESNCDYNYLISGKKSIEFDPFNVSNDVIQFYFRNFCRSEQCQHHVVISFCIAHALLMVIYYIRYYYKKSKKLKVGSKSIFSISSNTHVNIPSTINFWTTIKSKQSEETTTDEAFSSPIKSKNSEEMEFLVRR